MSFSVFKSLKVKISAYKFITTKTLLLRENMACKKSVIESMPGLRVDICSYKNCQADDFYQTFKLVPNCCHMIGFLVTVSFVGLKSHHIDVIKWKYFPRCWPCVRGIHRSPVDSPDKGQWRGALLSFYLRLNKLLVKQWRRRWFETPSRSLWRHCNVNSCSSTTKSRLSMIYISVSHSLFGYF